MPAGWQRLWVWFTGGRLQPAHLATGRWGEQQAEKLLKQKGWRILGRRVRVGRRGELDLVVRHGADLVIVEVKTRAGTAFGRPVDAVDRSKRRRLSQAAHRYARSLRPPPETLRFDVVEVVGSPSTGVAEIRHIEHAFELDRRLRLPW